MVKRSIKSLPPVSIVIVHRNSTTTILHTLESLKKQDYPIAEILIVDNRSTDDSLQKINKFSQKNKSLNIKVLLQKENNGISNSYNRGVKASKSSKVIIMQADCVLPSSREISLMMAPINKAGNEIVAGISMTLMPRKIWNKYNFWEQCTLEGNVDKNLVGFNGKFDYVNKKMYLKVGGFDEKNFYAGIGGEDADLTMRLKKIGRIVTTKARVVHLHYLGENFSIKDWILTRKLYARSYGKIIAIHKTNLPVDVLLLGIKPVLALASFIPFLFPYSFMAMIVFNFLHMNIMYRTRETLLNPRILLLPLISIGLIYYETFWMLEQFFSPVKKWEVIK